MSSSYHHRPSSIYANNPNNNPSISHPHSTSQQSSALQARINLKRNELENLKQLRDLSSTLAEQMTALESKLATLRDGTEAVAHVLQNWDGVLNVIGMAGASASKLAGAEQSTVDTTATVEPDLPVTLVRIPVREKQTTV